MRRSIFSPTLSRHAQSADSAAIRDALGADDGLTDDFGQFLVSTPTARQMYDPICIYRLTLKTVNSRAFEAVAPQMATPTAIPIGMVVSITGKDAEPYGLPMKRGFELAQEEINMLSPTPLMFVTADDQSSEGGGNRSSTTIGGSGRTRYRRDCYL